MMRYINLRFTLHYILRVSARKFYHRHIRKKPDRSCIKQIIHPRIKTGIQKNAVRECSQASTDGFSATTELLVFSVSAFKQPADEYHRVEITSESSAPSQTQQPITIRMLMIAGAASHVPIIGKQIDEVVAAGVPGTATAAAAAACQPASAPVSRVSHVQALLSNKHVIRVVNNIDSAVLLENTVCCLQTLRRIHKVKVTGAAIW